MMTAQQPLSTKLVTWCAAEVIYTLLCETMQVIYHWKKLLMILALIHLILGNCWSQVKDGEVHGMK